ncbi:glycosyltransferase, partial [Candidatus Saccharibacteria bacterium]|nr:glycosyltransferase [Candidatus Saccharibacteria bacterium]
MALVSVIVPVYNLEEEISKCIFSILLQKFTDYEIIAIDDGSTDNSLSLLKGISKKYPELRVFHTENNGLSAA